MMLEESGTDLCGYKLRAVDDSIELEEQPRQKAWVCASHEHRTDAVRPGRLREESFWGGKLLVSAA
jgi:hypothetical protein